jgi:2-phospho-L-lactate transferase/gluconeogenesis factor (CofD/UPF0052 family)
MPKETTSLAVWVSGLLIAAALLAEAIAVDFTLTPRNDQPILFEQVRSEQRRYVVQQSWQESRHLDTADDLFGGLQGSPRTDKMVAAAIQWAELIVRKIDSVFGKLKVALILASF